jgi:DNA-binding NarL/FixJ family response regulator
VSLPVVVADSAPAYRRGLSLALERAGFAPVEEPEDPLAWSAGGGCRAVLLTVRSASDWEPARCLAASNPDLVLVVLLVDPTSDRHAEALRLGARGVTAWDATPEVIVEVLATAVRGYTLLPSNIARAMARGQPPFLDPEWVTAEELDWLRLLAGGATIQQLANKVGYSERALYRILHGLYGRMRVSNRTEAILQARRWGLLS